MLKETVRSVTIIGDSATLITHPCTMCKTSYQYVLDFKDYLRWQNGVKIQDAFPSLSAGDREMLISGTCGKCFDKMFNMGGIMTLNPGDRVVWKHPEPYADPDELHGEIVELMYTYKVKWDSGETETVDPDDIEKEKSYDG